MRLATTTADFRSYCETSAQIIRAYEGTGFRHLDYSFYRSNTPGAPFMTQALPIREVVDAAKEAEKLGFDFVQAHSPGNDYFREDPALVIKGNIRAIEACAYLGIDRIVVHSGRNKNWKAPWDTATYIKGVKTFYEALFPTMEKYGVYVLAENYIPAGDDTCSFYRSEDLLRLLEACDHPLLGICWDIGHANLIHPEQYEDIVRLGDRLMAVHIQDNFGEHDDHICPLMGTVDIDAVMRGLRDNGFIQRNGVFTFEADNIVSRAGSWPNYRHVSGEALAATPSLEVKRAAVRLMYETGKHILTAYDCYED